MLHRMVSRSAGVLGYAALALAVASCEDNTTGTPLTPPPPSTAVYVDGVVPEGGYGLKDTTITVEGGTADVTIVTPNPVFHVYYPNGDPGTGQTIQFSLNLPGALQSTSGTVDDDGFVSPGFWVVRRVCDLPPFDSGYCLAEQRVIGTPASGEIGYIDVVTIINPEIPEVRIAHR